MCAGGQGFEFPLGKIAQSAWKELEKPLKKHRTAHNIKVRCTLHAIQIYPLLVL